MFINKLNQLYKPTRILYYMEATDDEVTAFYKGEVCDEIARYKDAFGTYDDPGVFFINSASCENSPSGPVIGIEYRQGDERIAYPEETDTIKSIILDGAFYYSVEIDNDFVINSDSVKELFAKIAVDDDAHRQYSDLVIEENPRLISVFTGVIGKKHRILYEWKISKDSAQAVVNDDFGSINSALLYKMAFFDPITGHYNWNHLVPFLEMPMDDGVMDYAFCHFDIKEFHIINEVFGHTAANKVLSNVVKAMNESDFVYSSARCHNDNFAMMIKDMPKEETESKLQEFFEKLSYLEEEPNYKIYYRCGVVPMKRSVLSGNRVADAGKLAQKMGVNHNATDIIFYSDKMHDEILWGNYIKAYLETAIKNDEFVVYLQPKFDVWAEKIKGAEALIRWNYKKKELLMPGRFVPVFEKDGSIGKVDDIVLNKVCGTLKKWKDEGRALFPISINLSRSRLYEPGLTAHLAEIVDSYEVDHALIDFELTESASYDNKEQMLDVLNDLRARGFKISMDDFGTGYSSLSLLTEMPLDTLKIDKSFVDKIGVENESGKDLAVMKYIISLVKELGFVCLAEGAEEKKQVDSLRTLGCDLIQGFYYSKPIPIAEYEEKYL